MTDALLPDFPVDDLALAAVEHAMAGAYTVDGDGTHHLVGAEFSMDNLLDFFAGIDHSHDEAILELLSDPDEPGPPTYLDPRPHYTRDDIIRSLIAEVRRLRGGAEQQGRL